MRLPVALARARGVRDRDAHAEGSLEHRQKRPGYPIAWALVGRSCEVPSGDQAR